MLWAAGYLIFIKVKNIFNIPIIAYQVSGEFSMLKLAEREKIIDYKKNKNILKYVLVPEYNVMESFFVFFDRSCYKENPSSG